MPDPLYSTRWTQVFVVTPGPGQVQGTPNGSNGKPIPYISGFMVTTSGTVTVVGKEGSLPAVTLTVTPGVQYHIACSQVTASTAGQVIGGL